MIEQIGFREGLVTDDVDLLDARNFTFNHGETDTDAISLQRRDGGLQVYRIVALTQVLAFELLFGTLDHRPIENSRFSQSHFFQPFGQIFGLESFQSVKLQRCNRGTFIDHDHQHLPFHFESHILEEPGGKQGLDRLRGGFIGHRIADFDRQVGKHRTSFCALYAFYTNILDLKGFPRVGRGRQQRTDNAG